MALGTCAAQPRPCCALRRAQLRPATSAVPRTPARRSRAAARPAHAKAREEEPEYLFGARLPRGLPLRLPCGMRRMLGRFLTHPQA